MLGAGLLASDHQGPGCWRRNVLGTSHINIDIQHVPQDVSVSILHSACALPLLARFCGEHDGHACDAGGVP